MIILTVVSIALILIVLWDAFTANKAPPSVKVLGNHASEIYTYGEVGIPATGVCLR